jgi:leucyl aminopeptidase
MFLPMSLADIVIQCSDALPGLRAMDRVANWLLLIERSRFDRLWRELPHGALLKHRLARRAQPLAPASPAVVELPNEAGSRVSLAIVDADIETFELLTLARRLMAAHGECQPESLGVIVHGFQPPTAERMGEALLSAVLAAAAEMPSLKSKPVRRRTLRTIQVFGTAPAHRFRRTRAELNGSSLARYLATLPSTVLTPATYRRRIADLAKAHGLSMKFMDVAALKRKRAGAFLAVAQGSPHPDAGIVRLRYTPRRARKRPTVALVGKGICFDTGGVNVKPARYMMGMQGDMQGSAVALGTLLALAELKVPYPVEAWLALAMNHIGPDAYKPTDVVTASNGTTIEVVHTDAEGRMVLADTLALCSATRPGIIIDYATLTGACSAAIGKSYSGVFTNRPQWWQPLIDNGRRCGERVWPFPLDKDFDKPLESTIADIRQCAEEGPVDHILAARFLNRFVGDGIPWIHFDLSSASNRDGLAHVPTHFNGFGVRYTLDWLQNHPPA